MSRCLGDLLGHAECGMLDAQLDRFWRRSGILLGRDTPTDKKNKSHSFSELPLKIKLELRFGACLTYDYAVKSLDSDHC